MLLFNGVSLCSLLNCFSDSVLVFLTLKTELSTFCSERMIIKSHLSLNRLLIYSAHVLLTKGLHHFAPSSKTLLSVSLCVIHRKHVRAMNASVMDANFVFRQLFEKESSTYSYLLGDKVSKEAVLIDPVLETVERDLKLVKDLGLKLKYGINTHMHADHITGTGKMKEIMKNSSMEPCVSVISKTSGAMADELVSEGALIQFGPYKLEVRETPGHTNGCVTYVDHQHRMAFTGDALLIRGCGRTDFQEGDSGKLYDMVHSKIFSLDPDYLLYPAHDYTGQSVTSVEEESRLNPRLSKTREEFITIMSELKLSYPKKIDVSLPWNKVCGIQDLVQM